MQQNTKFLNFCSKIQTKKMLQQNTVYSKFSQKCAKLRVFPEKNILLKNAKPLRGGLKCKTFQFFSKLSFPPFLLQSFSDFPFMIIFPFLWKRDVHFQSDTDIEKMDTVALLGEKRKYEKMKFRPKVSFWWFCSKNRVLTHDDRPNGLFCGLFELS